MEFPWRKLLAWYDASARGLPWRAGVPDPYKILVSEVMSQQSTMAMVMPHFERWMVRFPTLTSLASAPDDEVMRAWAGLGYYSRARNLLRTARSLVAAGAPGAWPAGPAAWRELPGVGPYTAAAVSAIAFDHPVIPIDGNVLRVSSRVFAVADPINDRRDRLDVEKRLVDVAGLIEVGARGRMAQALMELGSQICRPLASQTFCELCPIAGYCRARRDGTVEQFPVPKKRPEPIQKIQLAVLYQDANGAPLVRRIPQGLRLEGQWEIPLWEFDQLDEARDIIEKIRGTFEVWGPIRHSITRYRFEVYGVRAGRWAEEVPEAHAFAAGDDWHLTTLTRKLLVTTETPPFFG